MGEDTGLSARKASILRAVVEGYIATSRPVGSGEITRNSGVKVSSATVRKDLGSLEEEGFVHQPHTSAGRVPTEKGYRHFVDALMEPHQLDGSETQTVSEFFARTHGELERMMKQTSELLATLTDYAAVVVAPKPQTATVRSVQLVDLAPQLGLLVCVLSNGGVERRTIDFDNELTPDEIASVTQKLAQVMVGESQPQVPEAPVAGDARLDAVIDASVQAFLAPDRPASLYVGGTSSVAGVFDATETVEQVLGILEKQLLVVSLFRDVLDRGLSVAIGTETGVEKLNECSLVVAPYVVEGQEVGSIGVLGPTRMHYAQALSAVAIVSQQLGTLLSDR